MEFWVLGGCIRVRLISLKTEKGKMLNVQIALIPSINYIKSINEY